MNKIITIADGVKVIGESEFIGREDITSVIIPDSVKKIGAYAFSGCKSLTSITIPHSVQVIEAYAFSSCKELSSIIISEGVKKIEMHAFEWCSSLTSITIPNSVTKIGASVFEMCSGLEQVICESCTPPTMLDEGESLFGCMGKSVEVLLKVPKGSLQQYREANGWKEFQQISDVLTSDSANESSFKWTPEKFAQEKAKAVARNMGVESDDKVIAESILCPTSYMMLERPFGSGPLDGACTTILWGPSEIDKMPLIEEVRAEFEALIRRDHICDSKGKLVPFRVLRYKVTDCDNRGTFLPKPYITESFLSKVFHSLQKFQQIDMQSGSEFDTLLRIRESVSTPPLPLYSDHIYNSKGQVRELSHEEQVELDEHLGAGIIVLEDILATGGDKFSRATNMADIICKQVVSLFDANYYLGSKWSIVCTSNWLEEDVELDGELFNRIREYCRHLCYLPEPNEI